MGWEHMVLVVVRGAVQGKLQENEFSHHSVHF